MPASFQRSGGPVARCAPRSKDCSPRRCGRCRPGRPRRCPTSWGSACARPRRPWRPPASRASTPGMARASSGRSPTREPRSRPRPRARWLTRGIDVQLWQLLEGLADAKLGGSPSTPIRGLAYDSRSVEPGYLFAALRGQKSDGNDFVDAAIEKGAVAVLSHREPGRRAGEVAWVQVDNERRGLALMARNYYGRPDEQ